MRAILQSESSECGLACLAMICDAHGLHVDLHELRRRFFVSLKGLGLQHLIRHAEALGLSARPIRAEIDDMDQFQMPCILHWDMNHFVVLERISARGAMIVDPAVGRQKLPMSKVAKHFTGVALELSPGLQFKPAEHRRKIDLFSMLGRVPGLKRSLAKILMLALALEIFALAAPLFNQLVIDEVVVTADRELLAVLVLGFALAAVTQTAITVVRSLIVMRIAMDVRLHWTSGLFAHLLRLPVAFFERRHLGDVVSRFGSINAIQDALTTSSITAVLDGLMACLALTVMLAYSPLLTAIAVATVALYAIVRAISYRTLRMANEERLVVSAKESSFFLETVRAISPLKLAGNESVRRAKWLNLKIDVLNRDIRTQQLSIIFSTVTGSLTAVQTMMTYFVGATLIMDAQLTAGMLIAYATYASSFSGRIQSLIDYGVTLKMLSLHGERVADIALEPPEPTTESEVDVSRITPHLRIENVSFRYADGEPWILKDFSCSFLAGESVAVVGPSGSGKTTLVKLILGLLEPTRGRITVDGLPVTTIGIENFRTMVGAVLQDDTLLAGSIADNISFFAPTPDMQRVEECASAAAIHDEIKSFPMGYQTLVGDMGTTLSGGQKQRVFLARALYRRPAILILDEATSHLDIFNEKRVNQSVSSLGITRIIVAHRPDTIALASRKIQLQAVPAASLATVG